MGSKKREINLMLAQRPVQKSFVKESFLWWAMKDTLPCIWSLREIDREETV